jgi:hypothetical protein
MEVLAAVFVARLSFHAMAKAEPDQILHGRDMTPLLEDPESAAVAADWNKTPTMMTFTRNTYTAEAMAEKLKAKSWSSFQFSSGGKKGSFRGPNPGDNFHPCYFMIIDGQHKYIRAMRQARSVFTSKAAGA